MDEQKDDQIDQDDSTNNSEKEVSQIKALILTYFFVLFWHEKCYNIDNHVFALWRNSPALIVLYRPLVSLLFGYYVIH